MKVTINVEFPTSCSRSIPIVHNNINVPVIKGSYWIQETIFPYQIRIGTCSLRKLCFPSIQVFETWLDKILSNLIWDQRGCCFQQEVGLITSEHPSILNYPVILWHYNPNINFPVSSLQALVLIRPLSSTRLTSAELHLTGALTAWPPRIFSLLALQHISRLPSCLLVNLGKALTCIRKHARATDLLHSLPGRLAQINFSKNAHHNFQPVLRPAAPTNCKKYLMMLFNY